MRWNPITEATYYEMLEALPPTAGRPFQFATAFLFGDAQDHAGPNGAARYTVLLRITTSQLGIGTLCYKSEQPITVHEFRTALKLPAGTSFHAEDMDENSVIVQMEMHDV